MFNILDYFLKDESSQWGESYKVPLSLNLQTETLNGLRIGDEFQKLSVFGRPNNRQPFKRNRFSYYTLGLDVDGMNGKIEAFTFMIDETAVYSHPQRFANCEFTVLTKNGRQMTINKFTNLREIEQVFGAAHDKDIDEELDSISATYRQNNLSIEFECLYNGSVVMLCVDILEDLD